MSHPNSVFFSLYSDSHAACRKLGSGLPDLHYDTPRIGIHLDYAGIEGYVYLIPTLIRNTVCTLPAEVSGLVDLPPTMRGFNVSRTNEAIADAIATGSDDPGELNELRIVEDSALRLVRVHEYAQNSRVEFKISNYPYIGNTPSGIATHEMVEVRLLAEATKTDSNVNITRRGIGIRLGGALACPLTQAMTRFKFKEVLKAYDLSDELADRIAVDAPLGTHMEHSYSSIFIETRDEKWVDFRDLLTIATDAMGTPFREILKKHDELMVTLQMLRDNGPRFAEDVARAIIASLVDYLGCYSPDTMVYVAQDSLFTFSSFRIHIEKASSIEELRKSI